MPKSESRTRTREGADLLYTWYQTLISGYGASNGTVYDHDVTYDGKTETMFDFVTENYSEEIAKGSIISNPCKYDSSETWCSGSANMTFSQSASPFHVYTITGQGYSTYRLLSSSGFSENIRQEMPELIGSRSKLLALSNIDATPYAFGEDLFEVKETIKFLKSPFRSMADLAGQFLKDKKRIRKRISSFSDQSKAIADAWTEYRFAFSPLVRSAYDVVESSQVVHNYPERATSRGFCSDTASDAIPEDVDIYTFERTIAQEWSGRAMIMYQVSNPINDWKRTYGLRAKDLPEILWQIIPLSFIVDRVIDISNSISAVVNYLDPSIQVVTACFSYKSKATETYQLTDEEYSGWVTTGEGDTVTSEDFTYARSLWTPSLSDAKPSVNPGNLVDDITKIADLTALIVQRLRS